MEILLHLNTGGPPFNNRKKCLRSTLCSVCNYCSPSKTRPVVGISASETDLFYVLLCVLSLFSSYF